MHLHKIKYIFSLFQSMFSMLRMACLIRNACFLRILFALCIIFNINSKMAHAAKDPKVTFDEGVKFANESNYKKAEKNFKQVIKNSPDNYSSHFNLSLIYFYKENYEQSLKYWLKASSLNPFDMRTKKLLSSTYALLDKYENSRNILEPLTAQDPRDINSHKKLGIIYLQENNIRSALREFTLIKNLSPSDLNGNLLLATSLALNNDLSKALQKIKGFRSQLTNDTSLAFYAHLLEKNNLKEDADALYKKANTNNKNEIIPSLISILEKDIILNEAKQFAFINTFENLEISKRMSDKITKERTPTSRSAASKARQAARPFGLKATLTEKWEHYKRRPRTSSPINSLNTTTNIKIEGKNKAGVNFSGEWEGFYNRWDASKLDYYKINTNKRNNFEVDIGKFSAKHFPTLVSYPTVLEGFRFWKKTKIRKFEPTPVPKVEEGPSSPVNLGELYRENYVDSKSFDIETTFVAGRTQESKNFGDRKEKNEDTLESSGQFQQWTQAYRIKAKFNNYFEWGSSFAMTQDITNKTIVSETTEPVESIALSMDLGLDLLDSDLTIDGEVAFGNLDENTFDMRNQHLRDKGWILKSKYKVIDTVSLNYEQKAIGRSFKVEGVSQTQDKTSHTIDFVYRPLQATEWRPQSFTIQFKPEIVSPDGHGASKQRFTTVQPVLDIKLPNNSKYIFDAKYYREIDKCDCTNYLTYTFKNSFEYNLPGIQTVLKPSYTFERKNDRIAAPTDEKRKEYIFKIENKSIKNLEIDYSYERERKKFNGTTTKSYRQYINSVEMLYTIIPSRFDTKVKVSKDYKNPSDTNKTIFTALTLEANYTSKDGDDKFNIKYERKNNKYLPHSDSSAYHQRYVSLKYTKRF